MSLYPGSWTSHISSFLSNTLLPIHSQCFPGLRGLRLVLKFLCPTWRYWPRIIVFYRDLGVRRAQCSPQCSERWHTAALLFTSCGRCQVNLTWHLVIIIPSGHCVSHVTVKWVPKLSDMLSDCFRKRSVYLCLPRAGMRGVCQHSPAEIIFVTMYSECEQTNVNVNSFLPLSMHIPTCPSTVCWLGALHVLCKSSCIAASLALPDTADHVIAEALALADSADHIIAEGEILCCSHSWLIYLSNMILGFFFMNIVF